MENNSAKKLSRAAAILSLTAVLASMPVSAAVYAEATNNGAYAWAKGAEPHAVVMLSCQYGGDSVEDSSSSEDATVSASINAENYRYGEVMETTARAWTRGESVAYDRWA